MSMIKQYKCLVLVMLLVTQYSTSAQKDSKITPPVISLNTLALAGLSGIASKTVITRYGSWYINNLPENKIVRSLCVATGVVVGGYVIYKIGKNVINFIVTRSKDKIPSNNKPSTPKGTLNIESTSLSKSDLWNTWAPVFPEIENLDENTVPVNDKNERSQVISSINRLTNILGLPDNNFTDELREEIAEHVMFIADATAIGAQPQLKAFQTYGILSDTCKELKGIDIGTYAGKYAPQLSDSISFELEEDTDKRDNTNTEDTEKELVDTLANNLPSGTDSQQAAPTPQISGEFDSQMGSFVDLGASNKQKDEHDAHLNKILDDTLDEFGNVISQGAESDILGDVLNELEKDKSDSDVTPLSDDVQNQVSDLVDKAETENTLDQLDDEISQMADEISSEFGLSHDVNDQSMNSAKSTPEQAMYNEYYQYTTPNIAKLIHEAIQGSIKNPLDNNITARQVLNEMSDHLPTNVRTDVARTLEAWKSKSKVLYESVPTKDQANTLDLYIASIKDTIAWAAETETVFNNTAAADLEVQFKNVGMNSKPTKLASAIEKLNKTTAKAVVARYQEYKKIIKSAHKHIDIGRYTGYHTKFLSTSKKKK